MRRTARPSSIRRSSTTSACGASCRRKSRKPENPLPEKLKIDLLRLSAFIDKRIFEMHGLPQPGKTDHPHQHQPATSPPDSGETDADSAHPRPPSIGPRHPPRPRCAGRSGPGSFFSRVAPASRPAPERVRFTLEGQPPLGSMAYILLGFACCDRCDRRREWCAARFVKDPILARSKPDRDPGCRNPTRPGGSPAAEWSTGAPGRPGCPQRAGQQPARPGTAGGRRAMLSGGHRAGTGVRRGPLQPGARLAQPGAGRRGHAMPETGHRAATRFFSGAVRAGQPPLGCRRPRGSVGMLPGGHRA